MAEAGMMCVWKDVDDGTTCRRFFYGQPFFLSCTPLYLLAPGKHAALIWSALFYL